MLSSPNLNNSKGFPQRTSTLYWVIFSLTSIFLFFMPFQRGLFNGSQPLFDAPIFFSQLVTWVLLLCISISEFYNVKNNAKGIVIYPIVMLIPLIYWISSISPASSFYANRGIFIHLQYASFMIIGLYLTRQVWSARLLEIVFLTSGGVVVLFGFMNWFGDAALWGLFDWSKYGSNTPSIYKDAVMLTEDGYRLTSVFQYANSYAAYLIAILLLFAMAASSSSSKIWTAAAGFFMIPTLLSFILTLSRGGFIVLPFVVILLLPLLRIARQVTFLLFLLITAIMTFLIMQPIMTVGTQLQTSFVGSNAAKGWLILFGTSVLMTLIVLAYRHYIEPKVTQWLERISSNKVSRLYLPFTGIIAGIIGVYLLFGNSGFTSLLPSAIGERIENINLNQHSVLERGTFYHDAITLWKDHPIIGAGFGAWHTLYEKYQNNPYTSNQAHNYFLQTLVEVGLLGFIVILFILGTILYFFLRSYSKLPEIMQRRAVTFYIIAISILMHSIIDFNMSFVYLGVIVFLSFGGMLAFTELPKFSFEKKLPVSKWPYVYPVIMFLLSFVCIIMSINHLSSNNLFSIARANATQGGSVQEIIPPLDKAINKLEHPEYLNLKLSVLQQLYMQTNDEQFALDFENTLARAIDNEPYYKAYVFQQFEWYLQKGDLQRAASAMEQALHNYPWEIEIYERLVSVYLQQGIWLMQDEQPEEAGTYWNQINTLIDEITRRTELLDLLPEAQLQGRTFGITPPLHLSLGQMFFFRGDFAQAEENLKLAVDPNFDDNQDVMAATYYLAVLQKNRKNDPELMQKLLESSPDRQQQIKDEIQALTQYTVQ